MASRLCVDLTLSFFSSRRSSEIRLAPQFIAQYGPTLTSEDVVLLVSQSGETKDVLNAVQVAQERGTCILGLVNVIGSTLTQVSEYYVPLGCGYEISVPATKTYTNQVLSMRYLALRMGGHDTQSLLHVPDLGPWDDFTVLNSLRDVELPINLVLREYDWDDAGGTT